MQTRNDGMLKLSDKLREERKENSKKLLERSKEKAADRAEQLLMDKAENSEDGIIYLNDEDMKTIMETIKEDATEQTADKDTMTVGANLDLQV